MLNFMAILGISLASGFVIILIILLTIFLILKRKRERETGERCKHLLEKYGDHTSMVATFPYADAVFTRTNAPGQKFTEFVLPGRLHGDEYATEEERTKLMSMTDPIEPETLDPSLYGVVQENGNSSVDSRTLPHMHFSVSYDETTENLQVKVDRVNNLTLGEDEEAHCTASIMPRNQELTSQHATKQDKDLVIKQLFVFGMGQEDLLDSYLMIKLFRQNAFNLVECIGVVYHNLEEVRERGNTTYWRKLSCIDAENHQIINERPAGQILLRIGYTPTTETLKVVLLRARNLLDVDDEGTPPDPYIRVAILHDGTTIKKKKTSTKRRSFNPAFNQSINFPVSLTALPQTEIQVYVVHDSRKSEEGGAFQSEKKRIIGFVEIGPQSGKEQREHWRDLMSNRQSARWHHLTLSSKSEQLSRGMMMDGDSPRDSVSGS